MSCLVFKLYLLSLVILLFAHRTWADSASGTPLTQPNILIFLVDYLGARDLGCYGSDYYETPAIDQLAIEGQRFTQAYAAHPVPCVWETINLSNFTSPQFTTNATTCRPTPLSIKIYSILKTQTANSSRNY